MSLVINVDSVIESEKVYVKICKIRFDFINLGIDWIKIKKNHDPHAFRKSILF